MNREASMNSLYSTLVLAPAAFAIGTGAGWWMTESATQQAETSKASAIPLTASNQLPISPDQVQQPLIPDEILQAMTFEEAEAGFIALLDAKSSALSSYYRQIQMVRHLSKLDPVRTLDVLEALQARFPDSYWLDQHTLRAAAKVDPLKVLLLSEKLKRHEDSYVTDPAFLLLLKQDTARAWSLLTRPPWSHDIDRIRRLGGEWGETQGHAAITFALTLPQGRAREYLLDTALRSWCEHDWASFFQWQQSLKAMPPDLPELRYLVSGSFHPKSLVEIEQFQRVMRSIRQETPDDSWRFIWEKFFLNQTDADIVASWLGNQPDGKMRDTGFAALGVAMAKSRPADALQMLDHIADRQIRSRAAVDALNTIGETKGPASALDLALGITDPGLRSSAIRGALGAMSSKAPLQAIRFVRENIGEIDAESASPAVQAWADLSMQDALNWVESIHGVLPKRNGLMKAIISRWRQLQPRAFEDWLVQQEPSGWRDEMIQHHIDDSTRDRSEVRFKMAITMTSPSLRTRYAPSHFERWAAENPQAASEWLAHAQTTGMIDHEWSTALKRIQSGLEAADWHHFYRGDRSMSVNGRPVLVHY